ncbi:MAG: hypothetical protein H6708_05095 [Kofleriaceae bacterium]|nr:hypothetical protein [Kofleriaceae bacterium]
MHDLGPLATLEAWRAASAEQRAAVGIALADKTGLPEEDPVGTARFRALRHGSGVTLVAIPGGVYRAGLTDADLYTLFVHLGDGSVARWDEIRREVALASPRIARVAPFLCAAQQWGDEGPARFEDEPWNHPLGFIEEHLRAHHARLPTADEWEWVAREGGATPWVGVSPAALPLAPRKIPDLDFGKPNGFGVGNLLMSEVGELVSDDEGRSLRGGHAMWQDDLEAIALLCGYRWPLSDETHLPFRIACSLGLPPPDGDPPPLTVPDDDVGRAVRRFRGGQP